MDETPVIEQLLDKKILKVLQVFFDRGEKELYLREISSLSCVAVASTFRIIKRLLDMKIIELIKVNKFKLYRLSASKEADFLKNLLKKDKKILDLFVDKIRDVREVSQVILHGRESGDKANILLIGEGIDPGFVKSLIYTIKDKYGFTVMSMSLTKEQYTQMINMGEYSGEKKTLFLRQE